MKDKKKIIGIITILTLLIILIVVIVLIIFKSKKIETKTEAQETEKVNEVYTGIINCTIDISQEQTAKTYILDSIEVKDDIVNTRSYFYKIVYLDKDNYEGFKIHEKVNNPIYDDENLTIIYERDEKLDISVDNRTYQEYIEELENDGYTCNKEK